jgi:hypothetical protein
MKYGQESLDVVPIFDLISLIGMFSRRAKRIARRTVQNVCLVHDSNLKRVQAGSQERVLHLLSAAIEGRFGRLQEKLWRGLKNFVAEEHAEGDVITDAFSPNLQADPNMSDQTMAKIPQQQNRFYMQILFVLFVVIVWTQTSFPVHDKTEGSSSLSPSPDSPPSEIILMGFPKSGSESFHNYFTDCHSIKSSHKYCSHHHPGEKHPSSHQLCAKCVLTNLLARRPMFHDCGSYQAYTNFDSESGDPFEWFLPQHFALSQIARIDKNRADSSSSAPSPSSSLWILNVRDQEKWATNILHWHSTTTRFLNSFQIDYHSEYYSQNHTPVGVGLREPVDTRFLYQSLELSLERAHNRTEHERRKKILEDLYRNHTAKVTRYARDHRIRLVTINIDEEDPVLITQKLRHALHSIPTVQEDCQWKWDAEQLDNDWQRLDNIPTFAST